MERERMHILACVCNMKIFILDNHVIGGSLLLAGASFLDRA
jgi:hypothetical protein